MFRAHAHVLQSPATPRSLCSKSHNQDRQFYNPDIGVVNTWSSILCHLTQTPIPAFLHSFIYSFPQQSITVEGQPWCFSWMIQTQRNSLLSVLRVQGQKQHTEQKCRRCCVRWWLCARNIVSLKGASSRKERLFWNRDAVRQAEVRQQSASEDGHG